MCHPVLNENGMWQNPTKTIFVKCHLKPICVGVSSHMSTAEVMDLHQDTVFISSFMASQLFIRKLSEKLAVPGSGNFPGRGSSSVAH